MLTRSGGRWDGQACLLDSRVPPGNRRHLQRSHYGHHAARDREAALALGVRVAVHDSRQNDPNPVIWQAGQDYRMADAIQAARDQPARARYGPERTGPER